MNDKIKTEISIEKVSDKDLEKEKPLSLGNYLKLPLTEAEIDLHTYNIIKRIDEIIDNPERREMMKNAEIWRNQYEGIVAETNFPWPGAFNLDMRLTPKIQDAVVAQTEEAFDDVPTRWSVGPVTTKETMDIRGKQERVLDYYEDTEMSNNEDLEAIRHDAFLLGLGWEALLFERKFERIRDFKVYKTLQEFMADFPDDYQNYRDFIIDLSNGKPISVTIEYNNEKRRSPVRRHIEFEDAICPVDAKGVEGVNNADIKGRRIWLKYYEIKTLEEEGDYIKGSCERLKYKPDLGVNGELVEDPEYLNEDYETFEMIYTIYININGKRRRVQCLFNIEKEHKVCLRAIRYPYNHNHSYLIPHCIKYINKGLFQDGMGRMLSDIHIAGNATINHILNASVLANSLSIKSRQGSGAARKILEHQWYPGSVLELQNMDDAQQFMFATPNLASLISMFAIIERFGQDVSGIVNYQLGVESPEDPEAPASKTIALMRKAEIKLRRYIKNLKRSEDEAGFQSLRLIYQFISSKRLSQILGEDVEETKQFLQPPMQVIANSSGFVIEKIFEKRDDMAMAGNLMKDPLVAADPIRRARLWQVLAKSAGSNWDKKIIGIVPTPEELEAEKEKALAEKQAKKMEVGKQAATKVLDMGGDENAAREAGMSAMKMYDTMLEKNAMMAQQPQKE